MRTNKLRNAIRTTSVAAALGLAASSVSAVEFSAGDVAVDVYGFAQLNAVYDIDQDIGITTQSGHFPSLDFDDSGATGHFDADAQQSRLGVTATHANGVKVNLETDFRGGTFRIRHAYGEYGNWLAGRTWSNFTSFVGYTPTLDFDSNAGNAGVQDRVAQVRYTSGPMSFSLERPAFQSTIGGVQKAGAPVATGRFETGLGNGVNVSAAGLLQQVSVDGGDGTVSDDTIGFAGFVGANMALTDAITIRGAFNATDGANGYLYRSGNSGFGAADAYLDGNNLESVSGYGGTVGVSAAMGIGTLNVSYGRVTVDWDDAEAAGAVGPARFKTNDNAFVNYQWSPVDNVNLGVEYGYFHAENQGGDNAEAHRVMFASGYSF